MLVCPACGQDNPAAARFCLACGTAIERDRDATDERRIITAIFVDLVGFTARAERLDPEEVRAVLAPYHERVRREIESFGGVVEKFIGDAVMGIFGAPVAHGDDAERAVRAALVIRDIAGELAGGDLQIRIAVNTGEAIVSLGARPELGESMVAGDVVNTASRLQAAAPPNGIVVGEETYLATRGTIAYEPAAPVVAKGKEQPILAWVAVRATTEAGMRPSTNVGMVGRGYELAILEAILGRAVSEGRPHLVSVVGPAGVGDIAPGKLPTGIREIVAARLDALPKDERALLLDAAVVGRVFWVDALFALDRARRDPLPLLVQLERRDLVRRETGSLIEGKQQFAFTHALIRDVAYDLLSRADRSARHALVAEFFGETGGASGEAVGALALHWRAAGDHERAVEQLVRAAELAERGWAKDHAAFLYREAFTLIPEEDTERRDAVRRRLALASAASFHVPDVRSGGSRRA